jgi:hypothetical protein
LGDWFSWSKSDVFREIEFIAFFGIEIPSLPVLSTSFRG